jgi:hypothetical protein
MTTMVAKTPLIRDSGSRKLGNRKIAELDEDLDLPEQKLCNSGNELAYLTRYSLRIPRL